MVRSNDGKIKKQNNNTHHRDHPGTFQLTSATPCRNPARTEIPVRTKTHVRKRVNNNNLEYVLDYWYRCHEVGMKKKELNKKKKESK